MQPFLATLHLDPTEQVSAVGLAARSEDNFDGSTIFAGGIFRRARSRVGVAVPFHGVRIGLQIHIPKNSFMTA